MPDALVLTGLVNSVWSATLPLPDYGRVARQKEAARRRTLRVRRTEQWLLIGLR